MLGKIRIMREILLRTHGCRRLVCLTDTVRGVVERANIFSVRPYRAGVKRLYSLKK
jgi:hypothetical protein